MALKLSHETKVDSPPSREAPKDLVLVPQPFRTAEGSPTSGQLKLIEVGFWADSRDPDDARPDPAKMVDEQWGRTVVASAVALYARSGYLESFDLGYSFCRFGCSDGGGGSRRGRTGNKFMGCCTLTDGEYVWPEGLAHYISEHGVRPPDAFVERAISNLRALRESQAAGRLWWDWERGGSTRELEPGTAVFLREKTTLGIALPPEPEMATHANDSSLCSCNPS
ncbi:unnamed protein product [Ascophyllum nodosum]